MRTWRVFYTEQAKLDLRNIYEYIAYSLVEPETAGKLANRIMDAIDKLDQMPERHQLYHKEPWRSRGLRYLTVGNYMAFFMLSEQDASVAIIRIVYGGRNIDEQLS